MKRMNTNVLIKISVLSAMSIILMQLNFPLTMFFPDFLKLDISDLPALIGGFALGPIAGILIVLMKNIVHGLIQTQTLWVGELANFLVGATIVGVSASVYRRNKTYAGAITGLVIGTIAMAIVGGLTNYFILLPLYSKVMGWDVAAFVNIGKAINPMIKNFWGYILMIIVPFNILKGVIASVITMFVYKPMARLLRSESKKVAGLNN